MATAIKNTVPRDDERVKAIIDILEADGEPIDNLVIVDTTNCTPEERELHLIAGLMQSGFDLEAARFQARLMVEDEINSTFKVN